MVEAKLQWYLFVAASKKLKGLNFPFRLKAAAIHLGFSFLIAGMAAGLVFGLWYPYPYAQVSGGQSLFLLIVAVDLILGPALTLVIFNRSKTSSQLLRDLAIVAVLQLAALAYGMYSVYAARPVALVFEVDRFRVVTNTEVLKSELMQALPELQNLPLTGPTVLSVRSSRNNEEELEAIDLAMQGFDISTRPSYWQAYQEAIPFVLKRSRPVKVLYEHYPERIAELEAHLSQLDYSHDTLKFLPLMARDPSWSVLIDEKTARIVGFIPYDAFF